MVEVCRVGGTREASRREARERYGNGGACESGLQQATVRDVLERRYDKPYCQGGYRHEESKMSP